MRFLIIFLLFSTSAFSHETKFPYDYFKTEAIYHLDTGQIIYVEKYVHGYILWEKNATGRLNKLSPFRGFYGIAKECHAYGENKFELAKLFKKNKMFLAVNLSDAVKVATKNKLRSQVLLFSPGTSSFDQFKSFAERGEKFKEYVKRVV